MDRSYFRIDRSYGLPEGDVRLGVLAQSRLDGRDTGAVNADAHFSKTLTFVTDGPVFDLPAGYTASSISGNIADNHFVLAPVPLPAAIWLFGSAFGGLGLMRRRIRRSLGCRRIEI